VVATVEAYIAAPQRPLAARVTALQLLVTYKEALLRFPNGSENIWAEGFGDLGITAAGAELQAWVDHARAWVEAKNGAGSSLLAYGSACLAAGLMNDARTAFGRLRDTPLRAPAALPLAFLDALDGAAIAAPTAQNQQNWVGRWDEPPRQILFIGCDAIYAERHALPLLRSIAQFSSESAIALHVFDGTEEAVTKLAKNIAAFGRSVAVIHEPTSWTSTARDVARPPRAHYHIGRFVRFAELLAQHPNAAGWILDADLICNRSPEELFEILQSHDIGLRMNPGRVDVANQIAAGFVGVSATPAGRAFIADVAGRLRGLLRQGYIAWGTDQVVLYAVLYRMMHARTGLRVAPITGQIYTGRFGPEPLLWPGKCHPDDPDHEMFKRKVATLTTASGG
jgi:hypothetical protein